MSLTAGARLGPYEVTALLGAGGMGEVYRARDTKLNRDVALKVLPAQMAADPERLARLTREAQVLASLNHANIAAIHGLEDTDGVRALVLELVEGPTLADRIALGAVPVDEALAIAKQILDALEAAHEHGIVHRDLKPANIKIRVDGTVKVLDFGLAKALDASPAASVTATMSPTLSMHATQAGLILGTAAYMSPEQAAGKAADKRSDMWAFGVVLNEMLTGKQTFTGETVPHVLASVLKSEPDWSKLPADTRSQIRRLLRRCLEKDRKRRLDSAAAARIEIDDALASSESPVESPAPRRRRAAALVRLAAAAAAGATVAALLTWAFIRPGPPGARQPTRFSVASSTHPLAVNVFDRSIALSEDGRRLVYVGQTDGAGTGGPLLLKSLDRLDVVPLDATNARSPFLSPDNRWVGYFEGTDLKKLSLAGGKPITLCAFAGAPRGAAWTDDGTVVFATGDPLTGLWRVPAGGGDAVPLTTPDVARGDGDHWFPSMLPDGRGVLFTIVVPGQLQRAEVAVYDLHSRQLRKLVRGSQAQYVESGHLLYVSGATLWAVRFDLATLQVTGEAVPMVEQVLLTPTGTAYYAVSRSGSLVYVPAGPAPQRTLSWIDRDGRETSIAVPPRSYVRARLSPDGTRVALDAQDQEFDIWIMNLTGDTAPRRFTYGPSVEINPVWLDNTRLVYSSNRSGRWALYEQSADGSGTAQQLTDSGNGKFATTVVAKGAAVIGHQDGPMVYDLAIFPIPQPGQPKAPVRDLVKTPSFEHNAELSPNGRYLAYQSNESGPFQVIVRPYPQIEGGKWTVSSGGGSTPVWSHDGRELFYRDESDAMVVVPVDTTAAAFSWGAPRKLFPIRAAATSTDRNYDLSSDGRRFLFVMPGADTRPPDIVVVLDWLEDLKAKVPAAP